MTNQEYHKNVLCLLEGLFLLYRTGKEIHVSQVVSSPAGTEWPSVDNTTDEDITGSRLMTSTSLVTGNYRGRADNVTAAVSTPLYDEFLTSTTKGMFYHQTALLHEKHNLMLQIFQISPQAQHRYVHHSNQISFFYHHHYQSYLIWLCYLLFYQSALL